MNQATLYTDAEKALLRKIYRSSTMEQLLAAFPDRTRKGIQAAASRLGLTRPQRFINWSAQEDALLRAHYQAHGPQQLLGRVSRSLQAIKQRATRLGLTSYEAAIARRPAPTPKPTTEHDPRPKATNTLKPLQTSKARTAEPVKRSPSTPNLNAGAARKQEANRPTALAEVLADMKRPGCPPKRREAFTKAAYHGMPAAIKAWDEWPTQQQAA